MDVGVLLLLCVAVNMCSGSSGAQNNAALHRCIWCCWGVVASTIASCWPVLIAQATLPTQTAAAAAAVASAAAAIANKLANSEGTKHLRSGVLAYMHPLFPGCQR